MLRSLQAFFDRSVSSKEATGSDTARKLQIATAALFVEMTRADFEALQVEKEAVLKSLATTLDLDRETAIELLGLAQEEAEEAVELFQFTRLVDSSFSKEQKVEIIERLWQIAFADNHLDKHEEHLVRKVADLLHVPHRDFIAAKKRARA
jgi:uncharacterized tellurite resistance protein B-like protein